MTEGSTSMEPDARCTFVSDEADVTTTKATTTSTGKLKSCCTRLVSLVRSIGGLIVLLLAYTFIGAWIMMELESPTEKQHIAEVGSCSAFAAVSMSCCFVKGHHLCRPTYPENSSSLKMSVFVSNVWDFFFFHRPLTLSEVFSSWSQMTQICK